MKFTPKHKRLIVLGVDLLLIICFIIMFFFAPELMAILPDCILSQFGLPCLGCGGTRCIYAFVHFDFINSFMLHPFAFVSILLAIFLLVVVHLAWVLGIKKVQVFYDKLMHPAVSFSYLGFFIVFCILRIVGVFPTP